MVTRREFLTALASLVTVRLTADARRAVDVVSGFSRTVDGSRPRRCDSATPPSPGAARSTQAMDDIAAVGFRGIQLRGEAFAQFGDRPAGAEARRWQQHRLTFAALSSGNLSIDPAREQEELATHVRHAQFVRDAGGLFLQVIDERPKGRAVVADDYRRLGTLMTELGKRTADLGIPLVYHHHMNSLGEKPDEVEAVLDAADQQARARSCSTSAHYQQGGGDPVAALRKYRDWIEVLHLKDVRPAPPASPAPAAPYQFVELGRGRVDLPGSSRRCARSISAAGRSSSSIACPIPGGTPKESAEINKRYLVEKMHQTI